MSEFDKTWNASFKNYAIDIAKIYKNNREEILNCLGFESMVGSLNETYQALVKERELPPIELLETKRKHELWEISKRYSESKKHREMVCRSIYLLDELTK
jgi:hypothetical protein